MRPTFRLFALLACFPAFLLLPARLSAQAWKLIVSDHFDVYFLPGDEEAALLTGRLAENARADLAKDYDLKPQDRGRIVYRSNALSMASPSVESRQAQGLSLPLNDGVVVHPGSREGLEIAVREVVSRMLLMEISYSRSVPAMLYERSTYHMPAWYQQALAAYMATGWRYEDEMFLQSLDKAHLVDLARTDTTEAGNIARKSIWHFVATDYGPHKLPEIVYLSSISGSVESGLLAVLGLSISRFTATWLEFISRYTENAAILRTPLTQVDGLEAIKLPQGWAVLETAQHRNTRQLAVVAGRGAETAVFCYQQEEGIWRQTTIKGMMPERWSGAGMISRPGLPVAWNPKGTSLVTARFRPDATQELVTADPGGGDFRSIPLPQGYDRVLDIAWSPDGKRLAGSVLRQGQTDLFVCSATGTGFRLLTKDEADDAWPVWNSDSDRLFFCSNRDSAGKMGAAGLDLWAGTLEDKTFLPELLHATPHISEVRLQVLNTFEISYISDATGVPNLAAYNLFQQSERWLTNLTGGIQQGLYDEKTLVLVLPVQGVSQVFEAPSGQLIPPQTPLLSPYRAARNIRYKTRLQPATPQPGVSTLPATVPAPGTSPAPARPDSAAPPSRQSVRYYVFDEDDAPYVAAPATPPTQASAPAGSARPTGNGNTRVAPPPAAITFSAPRYVRYSWDATHVQTGLVYNPAVRRMGLDLRLEAKDLLHGHTFSLQVRPYLSLQLRSWDGEAALSIRRQAWTHGIRVKGYSQHYLYSPATDSRETEIEAFRYLRGAATYTLMRTVAKGLSVGGEAALIYQNKTPTALANPLLALDKGAAASLYGVARYDRVTMQYGHPVSGRAVDMRIGAVFAQGQPSSLAFGELEVVARNYLKLGRSMVFATRATVGLSAFGQGKSYYLGGGQGQIMLLNGLSLMDQVPNRLDTTLYGYSFQEFVPAIHGSQYASRRGTRLLALNAELRIPLLNNPSLLDVSLPARLEFIPFFDVGTAWSTGNPFSQTNPTDSRLINLYPVVIELQTLNSPFVFAGGAGLRWQLYGVSLRTDLAWTMENETLNPARLSISVGRDF